MRAGRQVDMTQIDHPPGETYWNVTHRVPSRSKLWEGHMRAGTFVIWEGLTGHPYTVIDYPDGRVRSRIGIVIKGIDRQGRPVEVVLRPETLDQIEEIRDEAGLRC